MRINVTVDLSKTEKEVYGFNLFDLNAVFVTYHKEEIPAGKRKWRIVSFWDNYSRESTIKMPPALPDEIKALAFMKVQELIKVKTWAEYKS
jgi:hypothetical protein